MDNLSTYKVCCAITQYNFSAPLQHVDLKSAMTRVINCLFVEAWAPNSELACSSFTQASVECPGLPVFFVNVAR